LKAEDVEHAAVFRSDAPRRARKRLKKRQVVKADGRYLIYYEPLHAARSADS
jgi:hypothetical protein